MSHKGRIGTNHESWSHPRGICGSIWQLINRTHGDRNPCYESFSLTVIIEMDTNPWSLWLVKDEARAAANVGSFRNAHMVGGYASDIPQFAGGPPQGEGADCKNKSEKSM
jgi:hypothetical protein